MSLADFQTAVDSLVRDRDGVITPSQRDAALADALAQYSVDSPRKVLADVAAVADGSALPLPAGFGEASEVVSAEYPISQLPTALLPLAEVVLYRSPTERILLLPVQLKTGDEVRITYTGEHLLDATDDTVPARHRQAVASLAASILCGQLASYYAGESESTIGADTVDRKTMSDRWRARARDLAAVYVQIVGPAPSDRKQAASVTVTVDRPNSLGGRKLFHPPGSWPR